MKTCFFFTNSVRIAIAEIFGEGRFSFYVELTNNVAVSAVLTEITVPSVNPDVARAC